MGKRTTSILMFVITCLTFCCAPVSALSGANINKFSANNILFYDPDGNCSTSFNLDGIDASGEFNENAILIMMRLISDGYSAEATAGVLGNLKAEGGAFNAGEVENGYGDDVGSSTFRITKDWTCYNRCGFGIAQWTSGGRQMNLQRFADEQGKPVSSLEVQADFLVKELTDKGYPVETLNSMSIEEVTFDIFRYYETPRSSFQVGEYNGKYYNDYNPKTLSELSESKTPAAYSAYKNRLSFAYGALKTIEDNNLASRAVSSGAKSTTGKNVTVIGDSITVRSQNDILEKLPDADIHAQVSKQFYNGTSDNKGGYEILSELVDSNNAKNIIVYALGTNSSNLTMEQAENIIEKAGTSRKVIFVNNYSVSSYDYTSNNNIMSSVANNYQNVSVVNWNGAVSGNPSEYMDDDVHPKIGAGTKLFAQIIYDAVVAVDGSAKYNTCSTIGTLLYGVCFSEGSGCTEDGFTYYWQGGNQPWSNTLMMNKDECESTIASSGCGVSATSMVYTALTGTLILPTDVLTKIRSTGQAYHACGHGGYHTVPGMVADQYGLKAERISLTRNTSSDKSAVETALRSGGMVIGVVGPGGAELTSGGHFIAVRGIDNKGDWKIFTSSTYKYGEKVNDLSFTPSSILEGFYSNNNTSYLWAIYK